MKFFFGGDFVSIHRTKMYSSLSLLLVVALAALQQVETIKVKCDYGNDTSCTCARGEKACEFELVISHQQTFTGYSFADPKHASGQVFFINETGELERTRKDTDLSCSGPNNSCSVPHTVDSKTYRSFIAVNGLIPGPTLIVTEGQIVVVKVTNQLASEATSIHWHGMHQRLTPWMDGVGQITQCPIYPYTSFTYIFEATPSGTFWYHSHSGAQRTDGLFGGLIVRGLEKDRNYEISFRDIPEEHTITLLDWQQEASIDLFTVVHSTLGFYEGFEIGEVPDDENELYNETHSVDGAEVGPVPYWSGIINGKGRHYDIDLARSILSVFEVERNGTYRFRLIGAQSLYAYRFSIDGHRLTVIAADGYFIEPIYSVDYLIVHSGERYDFVLEATQPEGRDNYWIRAETLEVDSLTSNTAEAILHYNGTSPPTPLEYKDIADIPRNCVASEPCTAVNCPFENYPISYYINCSNVNKMKLFSPTEDDVPSDDPDRTLFFNFAFDTVDRTSSINGKNFQFPSSPLTTQWEQFDFDKEPFCQQSPAMGVCVHLNEIDSDKNIRFVLSAVGKEREFSHPIHLHGHSFQVVHIGYGNYNSNGTLIGSSRDLMCMDSEKDIDKNPCFDPRWRNNTAPMFNEITSTTIRKDTVIVPAGGYVVIQFISDNPGFWFLHCHIEVHQLEGMAMVIAEGKEMQNPAPDELHRCGNFEWTVKEFEEAIDNGGLGVAANAMVILMITAIGYLPY